MQFAAHEYSLDQRSGLNLSPDDALPIKDKLDLQFYLRFDQDHESYFGYIFRIIVGDQNIDLIHGIVPENPNNFELIIGEKTSKIAFNIPVEHLIQDWVKLKFEIDFRNQTISCLVNDLLLEEELSGFNEKDGFRLMFGAHSFGNFSSTDVPAMILRDIDVKSGDRLHYSWPLNETDGIIAHSVPSGNSGVAVNPNWLLKDHNTWNSSLSLDIAGKVKTAFDPLNDDLYILAEDSLYIINVPDNSLRTIAQYTPFSKEGAIELIFNEVSSNLVRYSLDYNYVSTFDLNTGKWSPIIQGSDSLTGYYHHNRFIAPDGSIFAMGGYGYFWYKNSMLKWNTDEERFDKLNYKGDFHPRYLAGSGFNPSDSLYYIVGGYGSESGKQSESPDYYYDIHSFSLKDSTFSDVFEFQNTQAGFCFANSLVFDENNNMYGLYFPKYEFNNKLQLIKIPLEKPEIIEVGDPIEYSFLDVDSYADLFYSKGANSLIAVSSYTSDERTTVSVHTIAFPPQKYTVAEGAPEKSNLRMLFYILAAVVLMILTLLLIRVRKRKVAPPKEAVAIPREKNVPKSKKNSIILFGGFQVIDRNGKDITGQFTPLPKKLFLFILLHSLRNNKGVSSAVLYETFWFDKSVESARNNRAVNIVKLKSLLDNLDSANISKETGYWKFDFDPDQVQIDYFQYLEIIRQTGELTREDIVELLSLIENKTFLNNTQADWLDKFKSEVSNEIIDTFIRYMGTSNDDPEFLLHITNCIFLFDAVSEEALKVQIKLLIKQGKHSLAKSSYSKFTREYKQLYDEDYALSFNQLIDEKSLPEGE
ncbi:MAG: hypothetical protein QNK35_11030 [Bacteroides sp.]|nr:hypothetical protein [Bacteroides sp.]